MLQKKIVTHQSNNKLKFLQALLVALTILGFETISFIDPLYDLYGESVSIAYRFIYILIGLAVVFKYSFSRKVIISKPLRVILFFWFIYFIKALFDTLNNHELPYEYILQFWTFSSLLCFLPILFFIPLINQATLNYARKLTFALAIFVNIFAFNNNFSSLIQGIITRFNANTILNSITYGQTGVILIIMSLTYFYSTKKYRFIYIGLIILGLSNIGLAAARGPFLQLFAVVTVYFYFNFKKLRYSGLFALISLLVIISYYFSEYLFIFDSVYSRLTNTNESPELRNILFSNSWNEFLNNPLFGGRAITENAHNIFLGSLEAIGIMGGILMLIIYKNAYRAIKKLVRIQSLDWIVLILVMQLFGALTSGSIWDQWILWPMLGLVSTLFYNRSLY